MTSPMFDVDESENSRLIQQEEQRREDLIAQAVAYRDFVTASMWSVRIEPDPLGDDGPLLRLGKARIDSVSAIGSRQFHHCTSDQGSWVWELFPARWVDGKDAHIHWLVGVWPD